MKSTDVKGDSAVITLTDLTKGNKTKRLMDINFEKKYDSYVHNYVGMCLLFPNSFGNVETLVMQLQKACTFGYLTIFNKLKAIILYSSFTMQKNAKCICNNNYSFATIILSFKLLQYVCMLQVILFLRSICFQTRSICLGLGQFFFIIDQLVST